MKKKKRTKANLDHKTFSLNPTKTIKIYGESIIDLKAIEQMNLAMSLPISVLGSLMPDAHLGYGLPIGGVLATKETVIPYGVGVDIGCRMCLSVFPLDDEVLSKKKESLMTSLLESTRFGVGSTFQKPIAHPILDRKEFSEIKILKNNHLKAQQQIGTSGSGNHFVEFGYLELISEKNPWNIDSKKYLAFLSHSGSRGLGATIANHYTKIAKEKNPLPKGLQNLSWLNLNTHPGVEYWKCMQIAGAYASACHEQIHTRIAQKIGEKPLFIIENAHNLAWKEKFESYGELIVHRKGATPASYNALGIIPGSMLNPSFVVLGKGNAESLNSASHGAGRQLSRKQAKKKFKLPEIKKQLQQHQKELIGGGADEAPQAYKDILEVISFQKELIEPIARFNPVLIRMDG